MKETKHQVTPRDKHVFIGYGKNSKYWIKKDDSGIILGINNINA